MRTTLIAILFAGLLNCAYSAPQSNTDAVLQELESILAQNSPSEEPSKELSEEPSEEPPEVTDFLCRIVGEKNVETNPSNNGRVRTQWFGTAVTVGYSLGKAFRWWANQEQQRASTQQQEKAVVIGLACTPIQVKPNGELTFLKLK